MIPSSMQHMDRKRPMSGDPRQAQLRTNMWEVDVHCAVTSEVSSHAFLTFHRKKKKKMADKILSQRVRDLVPESQAYMDLLSFERKLDETIMRKKLDIQECLKRPMKVRTRKLP